VFIQDMTPAKIGKASPGMHVPVVSRSHFLENPPAYTVNFAWNYRAAIEEKEAAYVRSGGRWIYHVPTVHHT
jgi:hypothetical protein